MLNTDEPNAVNNTQIKNITCDSFNVTWDNVNDIFNYIIRWYGQNGDNGVNMTTGLSYTVTGLAAKTSYNVTVVASNNFCGEGQVSDVTMIMTDNECPSPTIISTASISNVTINMTPTITGNVALMCFYNCISNYVLLFAITYMHTSDSKEHKYWSSTI